MLKSNISDLLYSVLPGLVAFIALTLNLYRSVPGRFIIILLVLHFLIEMTALVWYELTIPGYNVFLNSIYDISVTLIITTMIYQFTNKNRFTLILGLFFLSLVCFFIFFVEGFSAYAPIAYSIQEFGIIALCLSYFWYVFNNETDLFVENKIEFVTVCVLLVLNCGSLFTSIMILQITQDKESYQLYDLQILLDSIANIALFIILGRIYWLQKTGTRIRKV